MSQTEEACGRGQGGGERAKLRGVGLVLSVPLLVRARFQGGQIGVESVYRGGEKIRRRGST